MASKSKNKQPNLLVIIVDNQWAGALGCYGNTEHRTPQYENVYGKPEYKRITAELDKKVVEFFDRYTDPRYDLWKGGRPKLITYRPFKWAERYGQDWAVDTSLNPEFKE